MIEARVAREVVSGIRASMFGNVAAFRSIAAEICRCKGQGECPSCIALMNATLAAKGILEVETWLKNLGR